MSDLKESDLEDQNRIYHQQEYFWRPLLSPRQRGYTCANFSLRENERHNLLTHAAN